MEDDIQTSFVVLFLMWLFVLRKKWFAPPNKQTNLTFISFSRYMASTLAIGIELRSAAGARNIMYKYD